MKNYYTDLGAVPSFTTPMWEESDPILRHTGRAAKQFLKAIKRKYARSERAAEMNRILAKYEPTLPARLNRVAHFLKSKGMSTEKAVEKALMLSLADATSTKVQQMGHAYRRGQLRPAGLMRRRYGDGGGDYAGGHWWGALGETAASSGPSPEEVVGNMFKGVVCSDALQASFSDVAGRNEGRDAASATNMGFDLAQGFAQCQPAELPAPASLPESGDDEGTNWILPVGLAVGGLAVLGGVIFFMKRGD